MMLSSETSWALLTLIGYATILFGIGVWAAQRATTNADFFLGDRSLGPLVAGLAYAASTSSAWVLLGFSGFVYSAGPSALWMVPGILVGYAAVWLGAGRVLQEESRERGFLTLTDFLAAGSGPVERWIRGAASLMIVFCFAYYVASQFQGAGTAFDGLFGSGLTNGVLLGATIILLYTFLGGFVAVSLIDTLQGLLIAFVAVLLPAVTFLAAGGFAGWESAFADAPETYASTFGGRTAFAAFGFVVGLFATGFGALGQPHLAAWIMASRSRKARITGAGIAIGWGALVYSGMAVLGLSARALFGGGVPAEGVFFQAASELLPPIFAGVIIAATLSAIMSTVDSQLLVVGAAVSHDLGLAKLFGGREVLVSRLAIVVVCAAAVVLTLALPSTIFARTLFAWTALGASFGPVVIARAFGCTPKPGGVLAALLIGFGLSLAYEFVLPSGPGAVWARTVPWGAGFLALWLFTAAGSRPVIADKSVAEAG
ncbi:sodium/proline symporter [Parvularcula lutaonensis]|uniref:Sodium/proline symporter n=1 Tax=Parvularcula lutaonensis TaxID=491923 RepID=A0ABV7MBX7_9PROT|nr:sodium/proline symporter [Parvularcula lutaonensis]GGY38491.1 sodium:proline symporter [Parvularcula lutaonensis]